MVMQRLTGLERCIVFLSSLGFASCAQVLDIPSDPAIVATGPWRCLQSGGTAAPVATTAMADVRVQACDFITNCTTNVTGLTAQLCDKKDVGCNTPRQTSLTDVNGEFHFQVPTAGGGFDGFLQIATPIDSCTDTNTFGMNGSRLLCGLVPGCNPDAPDEHCYVPVYAPAMLFFNPPVVRDVSAPIALQLFPSAALPAVLAAAGSIRIDPTMGDVFIQAVDCDGKPASGVSFRLVDASDQVQNVYLKSGVVSDTATQTDSSGVGGLIRVPAGFVQVQGLNSDSVVIGEIGVQSAASILTYAAMVPSPPQ
jgi:hypothetical protein